MLLVICFPFFVPTALFAQTISPFDTANQNPVIQVHGLPNIGKGTVLTAGRERYRLISDTANHFTKESRSNESVLFDGETERLVFSYARGLKDGVEWGINVPYVYHYGGVLDQLVESWHALLGLPQNGRDSWPQNQISFRYTRDGHTHISIEDPVSGLGDVQLNGAWQWQKVQSTKDTNITLRAQVTLPTGGSDKLLGSGGMNFAFWFSGNRKKTWFNYSGNLWGGAGIVLLGDGEVLEDQLRPFALFGSLGTGAKLTSAISLKLQLDYQSPLYEKSRLVQVNSHAVQLIIGGDIRLFKNTWLDLAVKEDPTVSASPDVVFHIGLTIEHPS